MIQVLQHIPQATRAIHACDVSWALHIHSLMLQDISV